MIDYNLSFEFFETLSSLGFYGPQASISSPPALLQTIISHTDQDDLLTNFPAFFLTPVADFFSQQLKFAF